MMGGGQWHVNGPDASSCHVTFKVRIVVIKEGQQRRDDYWHSLPIGPSSSFEINTKRLIIDAAIIVFVSNHFRYECSRTLVLEHVSEVSERLYRFLVEHHVVHLTLQA